MDYLETPHDHPPAILDIDKSHHDSDTLSVSIEKPHHDSDTLSIPVELLDPRKSYLSHAFITNKALATYLNEFKDTEQLSIHQHLADYSNSISSINPPPNSLSVLFNYEKIFMLLSLMSIIALLVYAHFQASLALVKALDIVMSLVTSLVGIFISESLIKKWHKKSYHRIKKRNQANQLEKIEILSKLDTGAINNFLIPFYCFVIYLLGFAFLTFHENFPILGTSPTQIISNLFSELVSRDFWYHSRVVTATIGMLLFAAIFLLIVGALLKVLVSPVYKVILLLIQGLEQGLETCDFALRYSIAIPLAILRSRKQLQKGCVFLTILFFLKLKDKVNLLGLGITKFQLFRASLAIIGSLCMLFTLLR